MPQDEAVRTLRDMIDVRREDIARAKQWLAESAGGNTHEIADQWLSPQQAVVPPNSRVELTADDCRDRIAHYARAFSLRLAFYQAVWELISASELLPRGTFDDWSASLGYKDRGHEGGLNVAAITCSYPSHAMRPPLPSSLPADVDIFLTGINCNSLHDGIYEAIQQALVCFRRGLYMPATAMLAASAEAAWIECGKSVAGSLSNTQLEAAVNDSYKSISAKVREISDVLRSPNGKPVLKSAQRTTADIDSVVLWTTNLRERRNALHWGKAQSFVADHSETASLLMGGPIHLGTLEAIRTSS